MYSPHFSRVLESLLVAMVTTVVIFAASILLGECHDLPPPTFHNTTVSINTQHNLFFSSELVN